MDNNLDKCEPVGEVVMVHEPEWMKPREGFKWTQTEFPLGTKFYTSPQPRDWVGLSFDAINYLWFVSSNDIEGVKLGHTTQEHYFAALLNEKLKQLNTKG